MRWDEAIFVSIVLVAVMVLGLGAAELLATALEPVVEALMSGGKEVTLEVTR